MEDEAWQANCEVSNVRQRLFRPSKGTLEHEEHYGISLESADFDEHRSFDASGS